MHTFFIIPMMAAFFLLQIYSKPYKDKIFNKLETFSLLICFMSYYLLTYISMAKSENTQICLFIFMLSCNLAFLLFWAKYYYIVVKKQAKNVISHLNSRLNSWSNILLKPASLRKKNKRTNVKQLPKHAYRPKICHTTFIKKKSLIEGENNQPSKELFHLKMVV